MIPNIPKTGMPQKSGDNLAGLFKEIMGQGGAPQNPMNQQPAATAQQQGPKNIYASMKDKPAPTAGGAFNGGTSLGQMLQQGLQRSGVSEYRDAKNNEYGRF